MLNLIQSLKELLLGYIVLYQRYFFFFNPLRSKKKKINQLLQLPLELPVVSCGLGKLYNQDAIIEYLLDPKVYGDGDKICSHIKTLKDTVKLNLTPNPAYNEKESNADSTTMGNLERNAKSKFICPISMKEMNGKHRFVYLDTCGCVFAEQALKEIPSKECVTVSNPSI